jgi:hypothetical protein
MYYNLHEKRGWLKMGLTYLEVKVGEATPLEICRETKIVKPTVIQALNRLLKLKKIERIGMGWGTRYRRA